MSSEWDSYLQTSSVAVHKSEILNYKPRFTTQSHEKEYLCVLMSDAGGQRSPWGHSAGQLGDFLKEVYC